jgi:hypothetical protein
MCYTPEDLRKVMGQASARLVLLVLVCLVHLGVCAGWLGRSGVQGLLLGSAAC